jgi:hypothetical protein
MPDPLAPGDGGLDALSNRREELLMKGSSATDAAAKSIEREGEIASTREKELAPFREARMKANNEPLPKPPPQQAPPPAPKRGNEPGADEQWLMWSGVLGALAGGLTRKHQTNALAAFTGAMEGYQQGSKEKFEQNAKIWDMEDKKAIQANKAAMDEYKAVVENHKLTDEQKAVALQIAASKHDDRAMAQALETKDRLAVAQLLDRQAAAAEKSIEFGERMRKEYQQMQQKALMAKEANESKERAAATRAMGTNPQGYTELVQAIAEGREAPRQGKWAAGIMNDVEKYSKETLGHPYDATSFAGKQRAVNAFATGREGQSTRSLNVAISHLEVLKQLGENLDNTKSQTFNALANLVSTEFGYDAPTSFNAVKQIVAAEIMKSIVPTGGGVHERAELAKTANDASSPEQLRGVIRSFESLLAGQMKGLRKQYEDTTGLKDFDRRFTPETLRALKGSENVQPPERRDSVRQYLFGQGEKLTPEKLRESAMPSPANPQERINRSFEELNQ